MALWKKARPIRDVVLAMIRELHALPVDVLEGAVLELADVELFSMATTIAKIAELSAKKKEENICAAHLYVARSRGLGSGTSRVPCRVCKGSGVTYKSITCLTCGGYGAVIAYEEDGEEKRLDVAYVLEEDVPF